MGQSEIGLVITLALISFALVVDPGDGSEPGVGGQLGAGARRCCPGSRPARTAAAGTVKPRVLWRLVYLVPVVAGCDCSWRWRSGAQAASCSAGVRIPMAQCGRMVPVPVDPLGGGDHWRRRCSLKGPGYGSARPCTASSEPRPEQSRKEVTLRPHQGDRLALGQGGPVADGPVLHPTVASDAPGQRDQPP